MPNPSVFEGPFFAGALGYVGAAEPYQDAGLALDADPAQVAVAASARPEGSPGRLILADPCRRLAWHALRDRRGRHIVDVLRARTDGTVALVMAAGLLADALRAEQDGSSAAEEAWAEAEEAWTAAAGSASAATALAAMGRALGLERPDDVAGRVHAAIRVELLGGLHAMMLAGPAAPRLRPLHAAGLARALRLAGAGAEELQAVLVAHRVAEARAAAERDDRKVVDAYEEAIALVSGSARGALQAELVVWGQRRIRAEPRSRGDAVERATLAGRLVEVAGRSFSARRLQSSALIQLGIACASDADFLLAAEHIARAAVLDPLDPEALRLLQQCGEALERAADAASAAIRAGNTLNATGLRILDQAQVGFRAAHTMLEGEPGRQLAAEVLAGAREETAWKLGVAEGPDLDAALAALAALGSSPTDDERRRVAALAPALSQDGWKVVVELARVGGTGSVHALALLLPARAFAAPGMPAGLVQAREGALAAVARLEPASSTWQVGRWLFSRTAPVAKLAAVVGIVLTLGAAGAALSHTLRRRTGAAALLRFETALAARDDARAIPAGREVVRHLSPGAVPVGFAESFREVLLRRLTGVAREGDRSAVVAVANDARELETWIAAYPGGTQ